MLEKRWRKAIGISLLFHAVLLVGVGWMIVHTAREITEQYIEVNLAEFGGGGGGGGGEQLAVKMPAVRPEPLAPAPIIPPAANPEVIEPEQAQPVVDLPEDIPILPAETSANMAANASSTGSGTGVGTGNGSGIGSGTGSGMGSGSGSGIGSGTGSGVGSGEGSGSGGGRGSLVAPSILSKQTPVYPEQARLAGISGTVLLRIQILTNGRPGDINIHRSSGDNSLDESAVNAVRRWRFVPAKDPASGQAVACYTTLPVTFRLRS